MTLKFMTQDEKEYVECKGLCYGEIMLLVARILADDNWKWQVIAEQEDKAKNGDVDA